MAKIPSADEMRRPTPRGARGTTTAATTLVSGGGVGPYAGADIRPAKDLAAGTFFGAVGQAATNVGREFEIKEQKEKKARDLQEMASAKSYLARKKIEITDELRDDPDYTTVLERGNEAFFQARSEAMAMISDPTGQQAFNIDAELSAARFDSLLDDNVRTKRNDAQVAYASTQLQDDASTYFNASKKDREGLRKGASGHINPLVGYGAITRKVAQQQIRDQLEIYDEIDINEMGPSEAIAELKKKDGKAAKWDPRKRQRWIENREAKLVQELKVDTSLVNDAFRAGKRVPEDVLNSLIAQAKQADSPETAERLALMKETQDDSMHFLHDLTGPEQEEALKEAKEAYADNFSRATFNKMMVYEEHAKLKSKGLAADALGYYEDMKIISATSPLDLSDPETFAAEIKERRTSKEIINTRDGINISLIRPHEIEDLKEIYKTGTSEQITEVLEMYRTNLDENELRTIAQKINAEDAPMLATAFTLPKEDVLALIAGDKADITFNTKELKAKVNEKLAGRVPMPEVFQGAHDAIAATYNGLIIQKGIPSDGDIDDALVEQVINNVLGNPVDISPGGAASKVFSYKGEDGKYKTEEELTDILGSLTDDILTELNGTLPYTGEMNRVNTEEIYREGSFVNISGTEYGIKIGDNMGALLNPVTRKFYSINAVELEKILKAKGLIEDTANEPIRYKGGF